MLERQKQAFYLVYGVQLVHMRKVLTVRTPFVFVNKTVFDYKIEMIEEVKESHIPSSNILKNGEKLPIPFEYYDKNFKMHILEEGNQ